ncbi:MAG: hypothetical protein KH230_15445 [Enterocloster asparagiformis]|nr:hypothetical protein [Enterocloster asparagiformis]
MIVKIIVKTTDGRTVVKYGEQNTTATDELIDYITAAKNYQSHTTELITPQQMAAECRNRKKGIAENE